jgi:hypothetical protein
MLDYFLHLHLRQLLTGTNIINSLSINCDIIESLMINDNLKLEVSSAYL